MPASPPEAARFGLDVSLTLEAVEAAQDRLAAWLAARAVPGDAGYRLRLVLDELLANLVMHGRFAGDPPPARIDATLGATEILLAIEDAAEPFDPRAAPTPAPATLEGEKIGGLGLALVGRMAAIRAYDRLPSGRNRTLLAIPLAGPGPG